LGFIPTSDQKKAISKLADFLLSENPDVGFILKGYAGTGKTSLIGALVKSLGLIKRNVVLMAPTGRAAKVLSKYSNKTAYTIHKQIYYQNEKEGTLSFTKGKNNYHNAVFIIDEASMVNSDDGLSSAFLDNASLLDDLISYVYSGINCKLIFIGDSAQLPPVGSTESPALNKNRLEQNYPLAFFISELKEVVRQEHDSGILFNATNIREQIRKEEDFHLELSSSFPDALAITGMELQDELETSISTYGIENVIIICRSNKRANIFNQEVRSRILWMEEKIAPHDLLMVVKNNYFWLDKKSKAGFIANGDILEVKQILKHEYIYGFDFVDVVVRFVDNEDEPEFTCKLLLETLNVESAALPRERLKTLFYEIEKDFYNISSKRKRQQLIMKTPHFNALQVKFSYALTCHKAQGGQWPVAFIDQGYLTQEMLNKEYLRWLYTAITRATEKVYFLNFNEQFLD
jgi:exodeoxyribonuclease-5